MAGELADVVRVRLNEVLFEKVRDLGKHRELINKSTLSKSVTGNRNLPQDRSSVRSWTLQKRRACSWRACRSGPSSRSCPSSCPTPSPGRPTLQIARLSEHLAPENDMVFLPGQIAEQSLGYLEAVSYRSAPLDDVLHKRHPVIPHLVRVSATEVFVIKVQVQVLIQTKP